MERLRFREEGMKALNYCVFIDEAHTADRHLYGGKGAGLIEMAKLGLPVPNAFIISTSAWRDYQNTGSFKENIWDEVKLSLSRLEAKTGKKLGDPKNPLFVSVRSGAPVSMPGILETKLNLGLNKKTLPYLSGILGEEDASKIYNSFPRNFPDDPYEQIRISIEEVFDSWNTGKAKAYRKRHGIADVGTAVGVQEMVWGNSLVPGAGTGVMLTRDTQKYGTEPVVTFAGKAQGPSVVDKKSLYQQVLLSDLIVPQTVQKELGRYSRILERHFGFTPQDIEFTYDGKKLWILQTRDAPLSPLANLRSKIDRIKEGVINKHQAIAGITSAHLNALTEPSLNASTIAEFEAKGKLIGTGLSVSIGTKSGIAALSLQDAWNMPKVASIVLADPDLESFAEIPGNVRAVVLEKAGVGSHLAREGTQLSSEADMIVIFGVRIDGKFAGKTITVDGNTGKVFEGEVPLTGSEDAFMTNKEKETAQEWLKEKRENPWKFTATEQKIGSYEKDIRKALEKAKKMNILSLKANEITAFNAGIPRDIRQHYTVIKVDSFDKLVAKIRPILTKIFASGHHATIRTCHTPALPANGPWALVRNMENFDQFLVDEHYSVKYGGFKKFLDNPQLTEILVGDIPVGKMESDPEIQYQHSAWTLSCIENDSIILQVHPHNPHLREHEKAKKEDLITYTTHFDAKAPNRLAPIEIEIGANLINDELAKRLGEIARTNIFDDWWVTYDLPGRMAALTNVLGINVTFEGQATKTWCLGYGIKTH